MKKSILSAVLCFWIAYLKACDKGGGLSPCICGNCDPELPLGTGHAFRMGCLAETTAQFWLQNGMHFPERSTCGGVPPLSCAPLVELRYS